LRAGTTRPDELIYYKYLNLTFVPLKFFAGFL